MTAASVVLTIVLVAITGYYAWRTGQMVDEMRRARGASLLPKLTLSFEHPGGGAGFPMLTNTGAGPALDVDVTMAYEPGGPDVAWTNPCVAVGESHRFLAPERTVRMPELVKKWEQVALRGTCKDALGETHETHQVVGIKAYWEVNAEAMHLVDPDYQKRAADELEKIRRQLEHIHRVMSTAYPERWQTGEENAGRPLTSEDMESRSE